MACNASNHIRTGGGRQLSGLAARFARRAVTRRLSRVEGVRAVYARRGSRREDGSPHLGTMRIAVTCDPETDREAVRKAWARLVRRYPSLEPRPLLLDATADPDRERPSLSRQATGSPETRVGWSRLGRTRGRRGRSAPPLPSERSIRFAEVLHWHEEICEILTLLYLRDGSPDRGMLERLARVLAEATIDISNLLRSLLWNEPLRRDPDEIVAAALRTPRDSRIHGLFRRIRLVVDDRMTDADRPKFVHSALSYIEHLFRTYLGEVHAIAERGLEFDFRPLLPTPTALLDGLTSDEPDGLPQTTLPNRGIFAPLDEIVGLRNGDELQIAYVLAELPRPPIARLVSVHKKVVGLIAADLPEEVAIEPRIVCASAYRVLGLPGCPAASPTRLVGRDEAEDRPSLAALAADSAAPLADLNRALLGDTAPAEPQASSIFD